MAGQEFMNRLIIIGNGFDLAHGFDMAGACQQPYLPRRCMSLGTCPNFRSCFK